MSATNHQGRKSMFKHGGDNIGEKYTSRLRDVSRGAKRRALMGGVRGHAPPRNFLKCCNLVHFGVYLDQILSSKKILNYLFLYKNFKCYHFLYTNFKITILF